jgi:hypothetical protein
MRSAALLVALGTAASCDAPAACDEIAGTCIALHVRSESITAVDSLQLDLLYGIKHSTTATALAGGALAELPLVTAIDLGTTSGPLRVGIVAAGLQRDEVLGTGAITRSVDPGMHVDATIVLQPPEACVAGQFYCGGHGVAGDPQTLYACDTAGVPRARGLCVSSCGAGTNGMDTCRGEGICNEGGLYCGGNVLDGDPQSRYRCISGKPAERLICETACVIAPQNVRDDCEP